MLSSPFFQTTDLKMVPSNRPLGLPTSEFQEVASSDSEVATEKERKKDRSEVASSEFRVPRGGEL